MDDAIVTGPTIAAFTTAIVYLWRNVQASSARTQQKLDDCEHQHDEATEQIRLLSVRVGNLEGQLGAYQTQG